jgi:ribosomal protein S27E
METENNAFLSTKCPKCGGEVNIPYNDLIFGEINVVPCVHCGSEIHVVPEVIEDSEGQAEPEELSEEEQAKRKQQALTEATKAIVWTLAVENAGHMKKVEYVIDGMSTIVDGNVAILDLMSNIFATKDVPAAQLRDTAIRSAITRTYSMEMIDSLLNFLGGLREQRDFADAAEVRQV